MKMPTAPPDFAPQYPLSAVVAPGLNLLGYNQDRATAVPGERVLLTLFWQCDAPAACEGFTVRLEDESGQTARTWQLPLVREGFAKMVAEAEVAAESRGSCAWERLRAGWRSTPATG